MARIDGILGIVQQQGANELRVGVGKPPQMFARGMPKKLSIPATSEETLRDLLGEILPAEREAEMREHGTAETLYDAGRYGLYRVALTAAHGGGFDVLFLLGTGATDEAAKVGAANKPAPAGANAATRPSPAQPPSAAGVVTRPANQAAPVVAKPASTAATTQTVATSAPVPQHFAELLRAAIELKASDLHLANGETPSVRIDGLLQHLDVPAVEDLLGTLALEREQAARLDAGEAIDLALEVPEAGRVRVHVYPSASGPVAAVRLLPRAAPSFASLNMPLAFDDLVDLPHGLVLICGAAGAGKSTTLAALAQEALRRRSLVLVTLEDPIEYTLTASKSSLVRRRQIGRDVRDFATGLRDALRADPEVLLLGEIRDPESIALALTAAETGHLVLASMHSGSAASAVERIIDSCPPARQQQIRLQLADSLRAIVAQRLLSRAHGEGRVPAIEVLRVTRAVASLIREGKTAQFATVLQSNRREGMIVLERSLADRVAAGEVRMEDAYAAANDPEALAIFLARAAH